MSGAHAAVVLAAGGSRRLGQPKQLLRRDGESLLRRAVRLAHETDPARLVVVLGHSAKHFRAELDGLEAQVVENAAWASGLASSLQCAAAALGGEPGPVLVLGVDQVHLQAAHLMALLDRFRTEDRDVASAYADGAGIPVVLRAQTLARAGELRADGGFRQLWADISPATVRNQSLAIDVDTPAQLAAAVASGWIQQPADACVGAPMSAAGRPGRVE